MDYIYNLMLDLGALVLIYLYLYYFGRHELRLNYPAFVALFAMIVYLGTASVLMCSSGPVFTSLLVGAFVTFLTLILARIFGL